jgi:hypothetical protein
MAIARFSALPGTVLPEGTFVISLEEDHRVSEILGEEPGSTGRAHPLWAFIATQRGIGTSVAELCALADFDVADGPMLAGWNAKFTGELLTGYAYRVTGEVTDIVRKRGKSGLFDLMTFVERLVDEHGHAVVTTTTTFVLPRKNH